MKIWSNSIEPGAAIAERYALCKKAVEGHVAMSDNVSPHLAWSGVPAGAKSLAVVCVDPLVPSVGDDVNQEGKTVSKDLPRVDFYHWALVDLSPGTSEFAEGAHSDGVTAGGKSGPEHETGRTATNNYTQWFAGDPDMGGDYFGYDGPAPPWNDELLHEYHFTVYALDCARLPLEGAFDGAAVAAALAGHVLDSATLVGTYTLNPSVG